MKIRIQKQDINWLSFGITLHRPQPKQVGIYIELVFWFVLIAFGRAQQGE